MKKHWNINIEIGFGKNDISKREFLECINIIKHNLKHSYKLTIEHNAVEGWQIIHVLADKVDDFIYDYIDILNNDYNCWINYKQLY